jgi:hypothetical protein
MASFNASVAASYDAAASARLNSNAVGGKIMYMVSTYTVPAGTLAIADKIIWGKIPKGSRVVGHLSKLYFAAGTASSTVNVGDSTTPARFLAATSVASAGSAVTEAANASGATHVYTADTDIQSVVAGAVLAAGQVLTLHLAYVQS